MPVLTIYSASAGSGKTYTLTREYLRFALATAEPDGFRGVLALTFTNDAAGEMKHRIVGQLRALAVLAEEPGGAEDDYLDQLAALMGSDDSLTGHETRAGRRAEVGRRATATFRRLLYDYADFAVSTIDSFGQRVVSTFARDLNLPAGFEVEMDTPAILREAVGRLLDRVNRPAPTPDDVLLTELLRAFAEEQTAEDRSVYALSENLVRFADHLFNDTYLDAIRHLTAEGRGLAYYHTLGLALKERAQHLETLVRQEAEAALQLIGAAGVLDEHFHYGSKGVPGYLRNWPMRLDADGGANSYVRQGLEEDKWASAKGIKDGRVLGLTSQLRAHVEQLEALREAHLAQYILLEGLQKHHLHLTLLGEVQREVTTICRERGLVLIGEFGRKISEVVLREPLPFIYERLGDRYGHLLIDEFQDTSALQWHNLLPLMAEAVSSGKRSLLVGDAKQAIYRWRGGELEQIVHLYGKRPSKLIEAIRNPDTQALLLDRYYALAGRVEAETLEENYRSAPGIVAFNNALFAAARDRWHGTYALLSDLYADSFQQRVPAPRQSDPAAHVELLLVPKREPARRYDPVSGLLTDEPLPDHDPTTDLTGDSPMLWRIRALVAQALLDGFTLADVAVLCRSNYHSRAVARFLKQQGFDIISRDSLQLDFADSVNLIVAVLRVLHNPTDGLARAATLLLLDRVVLGRLPEPDRAREIGVFAKAERTEASVFWAEVAGLGFPAATPERLGSLSLYEVAEQLLTAFELLTRAPAEADYLLRFLDISLDFSLKHGNNLGAFLQYWDDRAHALSVNTPAEGRDAITITTIHKSKGLAYGVVIVPFADWELSPKKNSLLWGELNPDDPTALPVPGMPPVAVVSLTKALKGTALSAQYDTERERTFLENLNMLYVAFTRPRNRLYILAPANDKPDRPDDPTVVPDRVGALLRGLLPTLDTAPGLTLQVEENRIILSQGAAAPVQTARPAPPFFELHNHAGIPWAPRLNLRRRALETLAFDPDAAIVAARERVNRLRAALRRLRSAADVGAQLRRMGAEGMATPLESTTLHLDLSRVLLHPQIGPLFQRDAVPVVEIYAGSAINGSAQSAPDPLPARVIEEPEARRVTLLDFPPDAADTDARAVFTAYAARYAALGYQTIRAWWFDLETSELVDLSGGAVLGDDV